MVDMVSAPHWGLVMRELCLGWALSHVTSWVAPLLGGQVLTLFLRIWQPTSRSCQGLSHYCVKQASEGFQCICQN